VSTNNSKRKILVVGELHQDLFYKTDAFRELANEITSEIGKYLDQLKNPSDGLKKELRSIIIDTMQRTSKKYSCEAYSKRGGNGNNSATILARLGVNVGLATVVGQGSEWMFPEIQALGIDTSTIFKKVEPTPISTIIEDPEITKIFIATNLKKPMNFEGIEIPNTLFNDSFLIFITPMDYKYKHILDVAYHADKLTAFTLELQKIDNINTLKSCVSIKAEFLFCNLDDAIKVCSSELKEPIESFEAFKTKPLSKPNMDVEMAYQTYKVEKIDVILRNFSNVRIYTLGKYGSWVRFGTGQDERLIHQNIIEIKVKNRTGAGDTFAAGFIAKLYESVGSIEEYRKKTIGEKEWLFKVCLLYATGASALKVSTGEPPSKEDVIAILKSIKQKTEDLTKQTKR
jgi:sugar/nucleoside kinase (ribokinase family)